MNHAVIAGRFNRVFGAPLPDGGIMPTRLIGGAREPLYLPARAGRPAIIRYTLDHAQSVLHEIAHWCLAGPCGRRRVDYGLIYDPPPRDAVAQARFYAAEVPVQALEQFFARALGMPFHLSPDNPGVDLGPGHQRFDRAVAAAYARLCRHGPEPLAVRVLAALVPQDAAWRRCRAGSGP